MLLLWVIWRVQYVWTTLTCGESRMEAMLQIEHIYFLPTCLSEFSINHKDKIWKVTRSHCFWDLGFMRFDKCRKASGLYCLLLNAHPVHENTNIHTSYQHLEFIERTRENSCFWCNCQINICVCMQYAVGVQKLPSAWEWRLTCVFTCLHVCLDTACQWTCPSIVLWFHHLWASQHPYDKSAAHSRRRYTTQQGFTGAEHWTTCSGGLSAHPVHG